MKKSEYKTGLIFSLSLFLISATLSAQEITKEYHKEFTAGSKTLNINNKYGDVSIQSWDKDQITIDVKVTVDMSNKEKAKKYLDYIDVQFSETATDIFAKTIIDDSFNFSGWGDSKKFSIDYTVKMPARTDLNLANKYGNSDIDELHGLINMDIKYGNISVGKLTRGNVKPFNKLNLAYGNGAFDEAGWLDLTERYVGKMDISKCQAILLDSKYSKLVIGTISSIVGESKYDNVKIDNIKNLVLQNGYTEVGIGELSKKLSYTGSYGSFSIDRVPAGFESLDVETHYMGVKLGIDESANYSLEARVSYGNLKYNEDNFKNHKRIVENNSTEISGTVGSEENPPSKVNVTASYGTVRLD